MNRNDNTGVSQKKLKKIFSRKQAIVFFVGTKIKPQYIKANDHNVGWIKGWHLHSIVLQIATKIQDCKEFCKKLSCHQREF